VACILYDNPDCSVEDWKDPIFLGCGEERSFSILKNPLNIRYCQSLRYWAVLFLFLAVLAKKLAER
jgi:hypothetical protein